MIARFLEFSYDDGPSEYMASTSHQPLTWFEGQVLDALYLVIIPAAVHRLSQRGSVSLAMLS